MEDWQQRVIDESKQLADKVAKLGEFQVTAMFDALCMDEKELLVKQFEYMRNYLFILDRRIAGFEKYQVPRRKMWEACLQMRGARAKDEDSLPKYKKYVFEGCSIEATSDMRELATTTWRQQGHKYEAGDMILRNPFCPQETWLVKKTDFDSAVAVGMIPTKEQDAKYRAVVMRDISNALTDKAWSARKGVLIDKMQDLMCEFYKEENEAGIE